MGKGEHSAKLMHKIYAERMSQIEILDIVVGKAMTRGWSRCQFIQLHLLWLRVSGSGYLFMAQYQGKFFFVDKIRNICSRQNLSR